MAQRTTNFIITNTMLNKEIDSSSPMSKSNKTVIIVVAVLVVVSFIALQVNSRFFKKIDKQQITADTVVKTASESTSDIAKENNINIDELIKTDNLPAPVLANEIKADDHVLGSKDAPVKLIVYSDFECPYCQAYDEIIMQAKNVYGDKLAIIFRQYPMAQIHDYAMNAALASECASEQGKFWEMYTELFKANKERRLNDDEIKKLGVTLKLDDKKYQECLKAEKYREKIVKQFDEGKAAGVNGTPTSFLNGDILVGANPWESVTRQDGSVVTGLKNLIDAKLGAK